MTGMSLTRCHAPKGKFAPSWETSAKSSVNSFMQPFEYVEWIIAILIVDVRGDCCV
jgi:hypothetical protein